MKRRHAIPGAAIVLLLAFGPCKAHAGGGPYHFHGYPGAAFPFAPFATGLLFGAVLGTALSQPRPAYYPYYHYPAPVPLPAPQYSPPVQGPAIPQAPGYWYYCASAQLYHPYAQDCPEGWQEIPRQPLY